MSIFCLTFDYYLEGNIEPLMHVVLVILLININSPFIEQSHLKIISRCCMISSPLIYLSIVYYIYTMQLLYILYIVYYIYKYIYIYIYIYIYKYSILYLSISLQTSTRQEVVLSILPTVNPYQRSQIKIHQKD